MNTVDSTTPTRDLPKRAATVPQQAEILLVDNLLPSQHSATNTAQSVSTGISDPPSGEWEAWSSQANFYLWGQRKLRQAVEKMCIQTKQGKQQGNLLVTSVYYQMARATRMKRSALLMIIYNSARTKAEEYDTQKAQIASQRIDRVSCAMWGAKFAARYNETHEDNSDAPAAASPKLAEAIHGKQVDEHQGHANSSLRTLEETKSGGIREDQGVGIA